MSLATRYLMQYQKSNKARRPGITTGYLCCEGTLFLSHVAEYSWLLRQLPVYGLMPQRNRCDDCWLPSSSLQLQASRRTHGDVWPQLRMTFGGDINSLPNQFVTNQHAALSEEGPFQLQKLSCHFFLPFFARYTSCHKEPNCRTSLKFPIAAVSHLWRPSSPLVKNHFSSFNPTCPITENQTALLQSLEIYPRATLSIKDISSQYQCIAPYSKCPAKLRDFRTMETRSSKYFTQHSAQTRLKYKQGS